MQYHRSKIKSKTVAKLKVITRHHLLNKIFLGILCPDDDELRAASSWKKQITNIWRWSGQHYMFRAITKNQWCIQSFSRAQRYMMSRQILFRPWNYCLLLPLHLQTSIGNIAKQDSLCIQTACKCTWTWNTNRSLLFAYMHIYTYQDKRYIYSRFNRLHHFNDQLLCKSSKYIRLSR